MILTHTNITVKNAWTTIPPYCTGMDVYGKDCYSLAPGQVVYIGVNQNNTFVVNVKTNNNEILRYDNLMKLSVATGQQIEKDELVGVSSHGWLHIEYVTSWQGGSNFPVRVNDKLYYKQDPEDIVYERYQLEPISDVEYSASRGKPSVTFDTEYQQSEFDRR